MRWSLLESNHSNGFASGVNVNCCSVQCIEVLLSHSLTGNEIEQFGHLLNGGLPNDFTME